MEYEYKNLSFKYESDEETKDYTIYVYEKDFLIDAFLGMFPMSEELFHNWCIAYQRGYTNDKFK